MEGTYEVRTTKQYRWCIPSPATWVDVEKAIRMAVNDFSGVNRVTVDQVPDDAVRVSSEDDNVVVWFEVHE